MGVGIDGGVGTSVRVGVDAGVRTPAVVDAGVNMAIVAGRVLGVGVGSPQAAARTEKK